MLHAPPLSAETMSCPDGTSVDADAGAEFVAVGFITNSAAAMSAVASARSRIVKMMSSCLAQIRNLRYKTARIITAFEMSVKRKQTRRVSETLRVLLV
jgi:hypothetical protein